MSIQDILAISAGICGVGMALSPVLQVLRMKRLGDATAVSVPFLMVIIAGACVWLAYGVSILNWSMIIANAVSIICSTSCALIAYRMHHKAKAE